jgi:hypothetical protein
MLDINLLMDLKKTKISPKLGVKQQLLYHKLKEYYSDDNIQKIKVILDGETKLSLRIIDWFVTNYSKKNNIIFEANNLQINVFLNYKSQLKAFSKKQFDPFCRRERINFFYNETNSIITTIGQLNFFKWALSNNILDYISNNLKEIELDMNLNIKHENNKLSKKKNVDFSDSKKRKKRRELSCSATNTINKHSYKTILHFE